jgi:hypothetical protein
MDTLFACNRFELEANADTWSLQTELLNCSSMSGTSPITGSGKPRRAAAFHFLQDHGMGRLRPRKIKISVDQQFRTLSGTSFGVGRRDSDVIRRAIRSS